MSERNFMCFVAGHAWREVRRWSRPGDVTCIVETVVTKHSGAMFAASAISRGMKMSADGEECIRCGARTPQAQVSAFVEEVEANEWHLPDRP